MSKVKLSAQTILPAGEHEAIVKDGTLFVAVMTGLPQIEDAGAADEPEEKTPASKTPRASRPVADDTAAKPTRRKAAAPPVEEEPEDDEPEEQEEAPAPRRGAKEAATPRRPAAKKNAGPVEILPEAWPKLAKGTTVLARVLNDEGEVMLDDKNNDCEYFTVDIVGYDRRTKELTVEYHVDGDQQVLQDGDQLFEYNADLV